MEQEKIYLIPRNLNRDFTLIGSYTIMDAFIMILLFGVACGAVHFFRAFTGLLPLVIFMVCKFKMLDHSMLYWLKAAVRFLYRKANKKGTYHLFERG